MPNYIKKRLIFLTQTLKCAFAVVLILLSFFPFCDRAYADFEHLNLLDAPALEAFYGQRDGEPVWVGTSGLNKDGAVLLETLQASWTHGLNPANYRVPQIELLANNETLSDDESLTLELMLTDGYIRYARDVRGMRVKAKDLDLNPKDWRQKPEARQVLESLTDGLGNLKEFLDLLPPQAKTYQVLRAELVRLIEKTRDEDDPPSLVFKGLVMPGKGYGDVPKLRARFDLPDVPEHERYTYDDVLAAKVMAFQSERGLKADGIVGERTLYALNITRQDKIRQLIVNLERLRWVPDEKPHRFIVVNIPSAMLWAIENGEVKHEMPVIVGRPKRETPSFVTKIHGVRFNPTWTVPPTIKQEDILPQLREDSAYFLDKGMELYDGEGPDARTIDPTMVDWNKVSEADLKKMHMVQIPGAHNPLGLIRVLMPNAQNIYLHDTNHHAMFDKYDRALSSGCIRMKNPEEIADFILSYRKNWKAETIKTLIEAGKTKDIYVDEMMPVYLLYYTAWVDANGQVVYGMDIYQHDKKLLQLLEKLDGFVI